MSMIGIGKRVVILCLSRVSEGSNGGLSFEGQMGLGNGKHSGTKFQHETVARCIISAVFCIFFL